MRRHAMGLALLGASALAGAVALAAPATAQMKHEGVEATVMTFTGPQIAEPLQRRAPDFKKLTGATINVVTVPFSDLYSKLLTDFATGTNSIDGMVFAPQWMGDFIEPGYLEDLTERVNADQALQWDDVAPFFRNFSATYNGKIYTIPLDGDFQMVYYRSDLLDQAGLQPPRTWDDYLEIAKTFHGQDLNGDGNYDNGGGATALRTFTQGGDYVVGLRVTDDAGLVSFDSQTLTIVPAPATPVTTQKLGLRLLSPFPVVRIAGRITRRGTRVRILRVDAPVGTTLSVRCTGRGCPFKKQVRAVPTSAKSRTAVTLRVRRLERLLPPGVRVRLYVTKRGVVGKYTKLRFRARHAPVRTDRCLMPGSWTPVACSAL